MFSDLQHKMICFPIILDRLIRAGKNKKDLPEELQDLLNYSSLPNEHSFLPISEPYSDLPSLANAFSFNVLDVVFGEQTDAKLMNIYIIQLTNKILEYYKNSILLENAIKISEKFSVGLYPSFQLTWYKAIMFEVNQEISDFYAKELILQAKAMLEMHEYTKLNDVLRKALSLNPNCKDEVNALFR